MSNLLHAMIPARFGSKRLKLKNLCLINGKPMIEYALDASKKSNCFDKVVINSDHEIFRKIAERNKVDFYSRPAKLGSSKTKSDDVIKDYFEAHSDVEILAWVNPISPFQTSDEISNIVEYFKNKKLDSLITVEEKKVHSDFKDTPINYSRAELFAQTQDIIPVNVFVYSVMMWRRDPFLKSYAKFNHGIFCGRFGTYPVSKLSSHIIKTETDIQIANSIMKSLSKEEKFERISYDPIINIYD